MKKAKIYVFLTVLVLTSSCASSYWTISPNTLSYNSNDKVEGIELSYKYNLLNKKYAKKETKKGIMLVAVKVTNNTENDITFGDDFTLAYENGNDLVLLDNESLYSSLKQLPATHLLYLLLTPLNLYVSKTNNYGVQETTSSIPIGLVIGPGLAIGNMVGASSANKKFKNELLENDIMGYTIKSGETKSGLIGIKSTTYDAIRINIK